MLRRGVRIRRLFAGNGLIKPECRRSAFGGADAAHRRLHANHGIPPGSETDGSDARAMACEALVDPKVRPIS